ncbi:MAG: hypothetical protein JWR77_1402 [Rhizorhabdus sp.]|nr:hypothetical protein [Rhizorhabdus sp.]
MRKTGFAALCATLLAAAPAQSACWSDDQLTAARVRDLQTFLMVETLRCQVMRFDLSADYNGFLRANRGAIGTANDRLKGFFIKADGPVFGQQSYDRFTTRLANAYGAGHTNAESCEQARTIAHEAAMMDNSQEGLMMIADRQGLSPQLPGGICGQETVAEAK